MIKLEDLKVGDKIYHIYKYYWVQRLQITRETHEFEYQSTDGPTIYCVNAKLVADDGLNYGSNQTLFEKDQHSVFSTFEESKEAMEKHRQEKLWQLSVNNNLVELLYEMAYNGMADADRRLYREAIDNGLAKQI